MRLSFLIALFLILQSCSENSVPREIQLKFLEIEPAAHNINWAIDDNIYQVDYIVNAKKTTSYFDLSGNWLETESEILTNELPDAILKTLNSKLNEYSIVDIELVKTKENQILYEVDLKLKDKMYDILFDSKGKILRKQI